MVILLSLQMGAQFVPRNKSDIQGHMGTGSLGLTRCGLFYSPGFDEQIIINCDKTLSVLN